MTILKLKLMPQVEVANAALALDMKVVGFDPAITVRNAWQLSSGVEQEETLDQLFQHADFVSMHVPLIDATRNIVNADRLALMNDGGVLINFARGGIVDDAAALDALDSGKLHAYVTDFPTADLIAHSKVIALPHLGASTGEAEENCAIMVAENVKDYLENGCHVSPPGVSQCRMPMCRIWLARFRPVWRTAVTILRTFSTSLWATWPIPSLMSAASPAMN